MNTNVLAQVRGYVFDTLIKHNPGGGKLAVYPYMGPKSVWELVLLELHEVLPPTWKIDFIKNGPPPDDSTHVLSFGKFRSSIEKYIIQRNLPRMSYEEGLLFKANPNMSNDNKKRGYNGYYSQTIDDRSIYSDSKTPSRMFLLLEDYNVNGDEKKLSKQLINTIKDTKATKYCKDYKPYKYPPKKRDRILVIGQVPQDSSHKVTEVISNRNYDLIKAARRDYPSAEIVYKPHPVALYRYEVLKQPAYRDDWLACEKGCDILVDVNIHPHAIFDTIDAVYTIGSQVGLEALLYGKEVHTFSTCFYAGHGLTIDHKCKKRRQLSLEALIYILYFKTQCYFGPDPSKRNPISLSQILTGKEKVI